MDLQRQHSSPASAMIKNEKGFALILILTTLPVVLAASFALFYSYFLVQNWMQSSHICRTELLQTQATVADDLDKLFAMNATARALRLSLAAAQAGVVAALAHLNFPLAATLTRQIRAIQNQRKLLDLAQKTLLTSARLKMNMGIFKAQQRLYLQHRQLQTKLPIFFSFSIHQIRASQANLAIKPDNPDVAPVYELVEPFFERQALHLSWKSRFATKGKESRWLKNLHEKIDSCSVSLNENQGDFQPKLNGAKFL